MLSGKLNPKTIPPTKRAAEKIWRFIVRSRFEPAVVLLKLEPENGTQDASGESTFMQIERG
jgi:hypothetical protein